MASGRPTWPNEPLYQFCEQALPAWHTDTGILDIVRISAELGLSKEAVYKWFRTGNLPAKRARELHALSTRDSNLAALADSGTAPPELTAFYAFSD